MKKILTRISCVLVAIIFSLSSGGCMSQRELKSLIIVMGIGLDQDKEQPDYVKLTAQIVLPEKIQSSSSSGSSSEEKPYWNVQSSGQDTFEAVRQYSHKLSDRLYIAHTVVFVIGKELAEKGIVKPMDFFIRARETRPDTKILISDKAAEDILETETKLNPLPAVNLSQLLEAQEFNAYSRQVTVADFVNGMLSKTTAFTAPLVGVEEEGEVKIPVIKGMAVFIDDKMAGDLNRNESRGLLWVKNWVKGGVINVDIADGKAALEILQASTEVSPELSNGNVKFKININVRSILGEQTATENLATPENLKKLEELEQIEIMKEIVNCFDKAKLLKADVFGFGEEIHKKYPNEWKGIKKNWESVFEKTELNIQVKARITSSGVIRKPIHPEEE